MNSKEELKSQQCREYKELKQKEFEFETSKSTEGNKDSLTINDSTKYLKPAEIK